MYSVQRIGVMKQKFLNPFLYLLSISLPLSVSSIPHLREKPRPSVMGSSISRAHDLAEAEKKKEEKNKKVNHMNLPCPVPYDQLHNKAWQILKLPELEGMGINLRNILNERFYLVHRIIMDSKEVPYPNEIFKISHGFYAFSAVFHDPKLSLDGEIDTDGIWKADVKYNFTDNSFFRINSKMTNAQRTRSTFWFGYKGKNYQSRFQYETDSGLCIANYIRSVTPNLSLGTEVLWQPEHNISQISFAAQYNTNKMIASGRVWNEGAISLSYIQILSEKVSLASVFTYDPHDGYVKSIIGYEYKFRECLLRGNMDTNGVISAFLEKKIRSGLKLFLFAKIDHVRKNYKYGYMVNIGGDQNLN